MSKNSFFAAYMSVFTGIIILGFISQLDVFSNEHAISATLLSLSLFDLFFAELCLLLCIAIFLLGTNGFRRLLLYTLSALFFAIYCLQLAAFYQGREFLSRLAIENSDHLDLFIDAQMIRLVLSLVVVFLALPILLEFKFRSRRRQPIRSLITALGLCFMAVFLYQSNQWLPERVIRWRTAYLEDYTMRRTAPVTALVDALLLQQPPSGSERQGDPGFSPYELSELLKFGFTYNSQDDFPLVRETIYSGPPPFPVLSRGPEKPNIIVIFTEGFSARAMGAYGSRYSGLTPFLDDFAGTSLVVRNYYNHTTATYRGLHGQLSSLYPTYGGIGGWQTNYLDIPDVYYDSLATLLHGDGYETIFFDAHHTVHRSRVDELIGRLGFETVLTGDVFSQRYLANETPLLRQAFSDRQLFRSLVGFLKERPDSSQATKPFFMGVYNFGTHAFLERKIDSVKYRDGRNRALNDIHNLDDTFGIFWEYFKHSPYAQNTIVIFTADHCHYMEKPFVEAFAGEDYQEIFVDRIPLIIHDPTRQLPATFDATNATSLDFAPSLIHYLGLPNRQSPFMGTSIFEPNRKIYSNFGVSSMGQGELYLIDDEKIHKLGTTGKHRVRLRILEKYINQVHELELTNRLWNNPKEIQ